MRRFFHNLSGMMMLPVLCLLMACGGPAAESSYQLEMSLAETMVSSDAGSVFVRVTSNGSWTLDFVEPDVDWAHLETTSGSGSKNSIILSYTANREATARTVTVRATGAGGKKTCQAILTQSSYTPPTPSGNGGGKTAAAPFKWLELPATNASDGMDFLWHMVDVNGKSIRNYSCYWSYTDRVSLWVAYPLNNEYLGSLGRTDAWGFDPLLPAASQQNVSGGYLVGNNSYYDRGHQIPSADRTANYSMNAATFYGTNMTPQKNVFNAGIWASLEGKVRDWSKSSDTLYVVSGCVMTGATNYVQDRSNNRIYAPTAYFKAVLRYKKGSTIGHGGYMGAAFWYDHEKTNWSGKSFSKTESLSISELEQKLGYQLFVSLPERVGSSTADEIKSEKPSSINWWW